MEKERTRVNTKYSKQIIKITEDQNRVATEEKKEVDACQNVLQRTIAKLSQQRQVEKQKEVDELRSIMISIGSKVTLLQRSIHELSQTELAEISNTLQAQQQKYVMNYLRQHWIDSASNSYC